MLKKLLCYIGIHNWLYISSNYDANRICKSCNKQQMPYYDMGTGSIYYEDI